MPTNIVDFIKDNPGCDVIDLVRGCNMDVAEIWSAIVDADRTGLLDRRREPDGWHFFVKDGA